MVQDVNGSNVTPAKNIVKVNVLRANVKQTKVVDTDIVFVLEDGRTVFIRDGAVQSLLDNGFSVEFSDGAQATGQELLQSAGSAEISSVALTGPQASSNDAVIVAQAPQAAGTSPVAQLSSGGGLRTWLAVGTPLVGGVLGGVLGGGGGSTATATTDTGTTANVKPATPVINVIANDDKVNATEKAGGVSVTGTSEASASVTVNWGSTTKTVTADSTGRWSASFASTEVPADAAGTTISATVKSTAGVSSDPATKTVQIDTTLPAAPVIGKVAGDDVVGPTEKTSGINVNGTAEAGSTVTVGFGGINKTVAADLGGNWLVNYSAAEVPVAGSYAITATAQDANGNVATAPASRSIIVAAAVNVTGQIVAGPVIVGNGLSVDIYLSNGTLLVSGVRVNADGSFTATNLPVGAGDVIFAKVVDSTTGADYLDEATGVATDLNAVLLAVKAVEGTSVTMNINPLTTIAAIKAGLAADGSGSVANAAAATNANTATAQAFGLSGIDITTTPVVATNSGGFTSADGLSSAEKVGAVLAALSGMDSLNGGNSQTTVNSISQFLNVDGSKGQLTDQGLEAIMRGAIAAEDRVDGSLQSIISDSVAGSSLTKQVTINAIATDNIITSGEVADLTISGTVSTEVLGVSVLFGTRMVAATVNGFAWSYKVSADDLAALGSDGAKVIQAQAALLDATSVSTSRLVTLKAEPPTPPSLNTVSGDNAINGAEKTAGVAFAGTGGAGSTIVLTFGSVTKNTMVDAAGTWTIAFLASEVPADGSATVSVSARDAFGNSSRTVTRPIAIDTVEPSLPTIRSVTGDDLIGPTEKLGGVQIQGTADALANIRLTFGNLVRTATADASGNWSVNLLSSQVPDDGEYALTVNQFDAVGNASAVATRTVRVDAQPPAKPIILPVATDNIINAAEKLNGVTLRGTAEPNTSIELTWGTISRTIRVSASGTWSASFLGAQIPADGTSNVTAVATDSSGNISEPGIRAVTIDTLSQNLTIGSVATDNVINAAEKAVNVTVTGQAEPGANVLVTLGGISRAALANQDGVWVVNFSTGEIPADTDVSTVTAQSTDQAGNVSGLVGRDIRIDTATPSAPVINIVSGDDSINADEAISSVEVSGTSEAGALVTVSWGTATRTSTADADGAWRTTFAASQIPPEGASIISATARDSALNVSAATERPVLIDIGTARPVINAIAGNDVINATERQNGVLVTGTAEAGATVRLVWGTVVKNPVAGTDGTWSQLFVASEIPLSGNNSITATPTDRFGNPGAAQTRNFSIDTFVSPALFNNVTGPDNIVNNLEKSLGVRVSGTAEMGSAVQVTWGETVKPVTASISGEWEAFFTSAQIPGDGSTTITAVVTDLSGNVSVQSGQPVTIDATDPTAPALILPIAGDNVINSTELAAGVVVAGTAEANADVTIAWGNTSSKTVKADGAGGWSTTFSSADIGAAGSATISVTQRDVAGNLGPAATAIVMVNTAAPGALVINNVANDNIVNAGERSSGVTISGTSLAGSTITVDWGWVKTATADTNGIWTVTYSSLEVPANGLRTLAVFQTDTLGNVGSTVFRDITVDTLVPTAPSIALSDVGISAGDGLTNNGTVTVTGLENVGSWQYSTNGGANWTSGQNSSFALLAGSYAVGAVRVRQTDAAGNNSLERVNDAAWTVDQTAPSAPLLVLATDAGGSSSDGITNIGTINVTGLEIGGSWQYSIDSGANWASGQASSFTLTAGSYAAGRIRVRQLDGAGNTSLDSGNGSAWVIDQTAPSSLAFQLASDTGSNALDNVTSNGLVNVTGFEGGGSWQYSTDSGGTWISGQSSSFMLLAGSYAVGAVRVRQTDTAGNTSQESSNGSVWTIDQTAPSAPFLALASDLGSSLTDGLTSNGMVNVTSLEIGGSWQYSIDSGASWTSGQGSSFTLAAGSYEVGSVQVRQTDTAGNTGVGRPNGTAWTIDTTAPSTPSLALEVDSGSSSADNLTRFARVLVGNLDANTTWQYSLNGGATWTPGSAESVIILNPGTYAAGGVRVRQTDSAGNVSQVGSNASTWTLDTTAPLATTFQLATDNGASATDNVTSIGTVTIVGLENNGSWEYSVNSGESWISGGNGTSFTLLAGTYAAGVVRVRQIDAAGNIGAAGLSGSAWTIDTTAPLAPTFTLTTDTGGSASDNVTSIGTVTVSGLENNGSWEYSVNAGLSWTSGGNQTSFTLVAGTYAANDIRVRQMDLASNNSLERSNGSAWVVDQTAPATPTLALSYVDNVGSFTSVASTAAATNDRTPGLNIAVLPGGAVSANLYVDGTKVDSSYDSVARLLTPTTALAEGTRALSYSWVDAAGNESGRSGNFSLTVNSNLSDGPLLLSGSGAADLSEDDNLSNGSSVGEILRPSHLGLTDAQLAGASSISFTLLTNITVWRLSAPGDVTSAASPLATGAVITLSEIRTGAIVLRYSQADSATNGMSAVADLTVTSSNQGTYAKSIDFALNASGGAVIWGDESGDGGDRSAVGSNGAGGSDLLFGTLGNDLIFGDGSGGGGGDATYNGASGRAPGLGGAGADVIRAGSGNDVIFGDGFHGSSPDVWSTSGGVGGYGGGGGGGAGSYQNAFGIGGLGSNGGGNGGTTTSADRAPVGGISSLGNTTVGRAGGGGRGVSSDGDLTAGTNYVAEIDVNPSNTAGQFNNTGSVNSSVTNAASAFLDGVGGTNAEDRLFTQTMGAGNDIIYGGSGNDYIMAGNGNDTIYGGQGNDIIYGRGGGRFSVSDNDVFVWQRGDAGPVGALDIIRDFGGNTSGLANSATLGIDQLNISDLLEGYTAGTSNLADWVTVTTLDGTTNNLANQAHLAGMIPASGPDRTAAGTLIAIDVDGAGAGTVMQYIFLQGTTFNTTNIASLAANSVIQA